ncbi:Serine/threonine-protein phosphatase 6 regulatory ankyrin repeat subunit C [Chaetomidium leptoderma]|uniref:Serine/threonine-protein phosphatase 6 regulatory ankyrin repeat subunit C n=1 Tax=Chaetomidium leptoderma TaxID=669021 RepID=A0AAN6VLR8_9PEZI|nr:Serine/threonine-protein phosphatase 6 regulatory ankyrin repeat subunit C [Chaetomidium leptoderma]
MSKAHGLSDLHVATISGQTRRVLDLISVDNNKELINAQDTDGTTPLMTAVLTGRLAIARLLLQNGASARIKDRRGKTALDYSRSSAFKKKLQIYRRLRVPPVSDKQRRNRVLAAKTLRYPAALESWSDGTRLKVLKPDITFIIAKQGLERATSGFIASATKPDVKVAAVSGWQPNPARGRDVLDSPKYLQLVQDFAGILRFRLIRSQRDNNGKHLPEHSGRFVASHVEKKLAVFWVIATRKAVLNTTDLRWARELREVVIPEPWKTAWVVLDHSPCGNCWEFLEQIRRVTGINIYVETRPFLVKGQRQTAGGCKECPCDRCKDKFRSEPAKGKVSPEEQEEDEYGDIESSPSDEDVTQPNLVAGPDVGPEVNDDGLTLQENDDTEGRPPQARVPKPQPMSSDPPRVSSKPTSTFTNVLMFL